MDDQLPFQFPIYPCPHKKSRELFVDYGSCSAIGSIDGKTVTTQKGSCKGYTNYAASQPVLPLNSTCVKGLLISISFCYTGFFI